MNVNDITKHLIKYLSHYGVTTINYFDRVNMYLDARARKDYLSDILASNINNKLTMKEFTPNSHLDRFLEIFQPDDQHFKQLKTISGNCAISYVECAFDFMTDDDRVLNHLAYFFNRHFVHATVKDKARTFYYNNFDDLDETIYFTPPADKLQLLMYTDKEARKCKGLKCLHLEYRIYGLDLVKNQGIITINNLLNFDHIQLWDNLLDFRKYNLTELGRLLEPSLSASEYGPTRKTFNKWGDMESDDIYSLQEYLEMKPKREPAFKEILTVGVLKKLVDDVFIDTE